MIFVRKKGKFMAKKEVVKDTIQKAEDYITVLKTHLTEEPVREFRKELNNMKRERFNWNEV